MRATFRTTVLLALIACGAIAQEDPVQRINDTVDASQKARRAGQESLDGWAGERSALKQRWESAEAQIEYLDERVALERDRLSENEELVLLSSEPLDPRSFPDGPSGLELLASGTGGEPPLRLPLRGVLTENSAEGARVELWPLSPAGDGLPVSLEPRSTSWPTRTRRAWPCPGRTWAGTPRACWSRPRTCRSR